MNVSKLIESPLNTLLVTFFNVTKAAKSDDFVVRSSFKSSKYASIECSPYIYHEVANNLTLRYPPLFFTQTNNTEIMSYILNDRGWSLDKLRSEIYKNILVKISQLHDTSNLTNDIATTLFLLRGSADFQRHYYAVDILNATQNYIENLFNILLSSDDLVSHLNLNFRELQAQYTQGTNKRNAQIRINLKWFYENIAKHTHINVYKQNILDTNIVNLGDERTFKNFEKRIQFYQESILKRPLKPNEVEALREELNFTIKDTIVTDKSFANTRNQQIVMYARETLPDECAGCHGKYDISCRSFLMPRNERYYFEINHVVAYANDAKRVDVFDNLVKLCPTCHRALTPGRAHENLQKEIIHRMLKSRSAVQDFVTLLMTTSGSNIASPEDYVFQNLR